MIAKSNFWKWARIILVGLLLCNSTFTWSQEIKFKVPTPVQEEDDDIIILNSIKRNDEFPVSLKNSTGKYYTKTVRYTIFGDDTLFATFTNLLYLRLDSVQGVQFDVYISRLNHSEYRFPVTPEKKGNLYIFDLTSLPEMGKYGPAQFDLVITDQRKNVLHTISWERYMVAGSR